MVDRTQLPPISRFSRAARIVKNLIHVCKVCKSLMEAAVSAEDWYRLMDTYLDTSSSFQPHTPKTRPFVTFVPDGKKGLTQLTFDKSEFARDCRADYLLTDSIRDMLKTPALERTPDQELDILRFLKKLSPDFSTYHLDTQKRLINCMFYDKYERNRVITRKGLQADGVYFIISGSLVEKTHDKKELKELKSGQRFGEKDIECGCARRTTVVTRTEVELVTIHRLDFRSICNMADDSNNPKYLEVCKKDVVFQHFPLNKLTDNPGVWTVLSYKFGRLIVKDSNELEWIYIIKSGEARVIKQLEKDKVNMTERHMHIQGKMDDQDPFHQAQTIINFITTENTVKSLYKLGQYHPPRLVKSAPHSRHSWLSTPPQSLSRASSRLSELVSEDTRPSTVGAAGTSTMSPCHRAKSARVDPMMARIHNQRNITKEQMIGETVQTSPAMWPENRMGLLSKKVFETSTNADSSGKNADSSSTSSSDDLKGKENGTVGQKPRVRIVEGGLGKGSEKKGGKETKSAFIKTAAIIEEPEAGKMIDVPPFVQLETLHPGMVFGMRACLDEEERGPSASLVSGGCEVLQINKKFFLKNADDALLSLIKVKHKPYPTEDDLLDRLDVNFQWNEYKQKTVHGFVQTMKKRKGKIN